MKKLSLSLINIKIIKLSVAIVLFATVLAILTGLKIITNLSNNHVSNTEEWKTYRNQNYHVSLKYPSVWKLNPDYTERYEGNNGFFQISAINGKNLTIDEVTELDAYHMLKPYGSTPEIKKLKIGGQEARLILPSDDQAKEMQNQTGIIVKYPTPVKIDGGTYHYFILWADKNHIEQISQSISFID